MALINELVEEVWELSVKATHLFLSNEEIQKIKEYVPQALSEIPHLIVGENENAVPIAFMGIDGQKLEMLFIAVEERERGRAYQSQKGLQHSRFRQQHGQYLMYQGETALDYAKESPKKNIDKYLI